jgi:hypothetical protein
MAHADLSMISDKHLPLISLISKLFELLCRLESKPEAYLVMRHYVIAKLFSFSTPSYANVDRNRLPDQILEKGREPLACAL